MIWISFYIFKTLYFSSFGTSCKYRKQQRMLFEKGIKRNNTKYLKKCTMCVNREIIVIFSNSYILNLYIVDIFWSLCGRVTLSTATKLFHLFERFKQCAACDEIILFCVSGKKENAICLLSVIIRFLCSKTLVFLTSLSIIIFSCNSKQMLERKTYQVHYYEYISAGVV